MKPSLACLALATLLPMTAWAQSISLAPGARVRVTSPSDNLKRHVSTIAEVRGDSIVMSEAGGSRTIALSNVTSLDVSSGKRSNAGRYALFGLGIGALVGATAMSEAHEDCNEDLTFCPIPVSRGHFAAASALVAGTMGLLTGAIAGSLHRTERWENQPGIRASIAPSASGGVQLSFSRKF